MTDKTRDILFYHLPALVYAALIIGISSIPKLRTPELGFIATDKLLHFVEYGVFAFLFYRSFSRLQRLRSGRLVALLTVMFLALFAAGDEYHQRFVRGRVMDEFDFVADIAGGALVTLWLSRRSRSRPGNSGDTRKS